MSDFVHFYSRRADEVNCEDLHEFYFCTELSLNGASLRVDAAGADDDEVYGCAHCKNGS